jgi:hypothetical protein
MKKSKKRILGDLILLIIIKEKVGYSNLRLRAINLAGKNNRLEVFIDNVIIYS